MSYGGFYTRQEQEDVLTARIDNPNRVGSGFINFGAMERNTQPAANWQTGSLIGGGGAVAPPQVSEIWAAAPKAPQSQPSQPRPQPPTMPQMPVAPQPFAQPTSAPFAASQQGDHSLLNSINALSLDPAAQARVAAAQAPRPPVPSAPFAPMGGMPPAQQPLQQPLQQPFLNGTSAAQPQPSTQALLSMLNAPPPPAPSLNPAFGGGLGNGTVPNAGASRVNAFSAMPTVTQPFQQPSPVASFGPPPPGFGPPPTSARAPPPPAAPAVPKTLSSAADYGMAAMAYKPPAAPVDTIQSVSRKPEQQSSAARGAAGARAAETRANEEWECARCTFINNASLWECEMCQLERPGKHEHQEAAKAATPRDSDAGWRTASARKPAAPAANTNAGAASGKSKAQSKNEKRRAKKRSDEQ